MSNERELAELRAAKCYYNWHGMVKEPENSSDIIEAYFLGFWTAFDDDQQIVFLSMCNNADFRILVKYDIWK